MRTNRHTILAALAASLLAAACSSTPYIAKGDDANQPSKLNVNVHLPGGEGEINQHGFAGSTQGNKVNYIVDNQHYSGEVVTDEDLTTLYLKILGYAKLGHNVSIAASDDNAKGEKTDVHTFSSDKEADVAVWAARMVKRGYNVSIAYDKSTHTYTCTAYKKK